jgi:hypothetical protein
MSRLIVGKFDNQFAAASASAKLLSRGLQHSHIVSYADESVGNSAASSSVPTSIISRLGEAGEHHHKSSELRSPSQLPAPAMMGHTVLTVDPADDVSADEVRHVMELAGATSVEALEMEPPIENPSMWPEHATGYAVDVERAIRAAKGGEALESYVRH